MQASVNLWGVMTKERMQERCDVVIVGAGFAGMYALHSLRKAGYKVQVIERGSDVGGTWYWNRYPGARCDVESMEYSYSFSESLQQEWNWTERYSGQPEILRYAQHVADRFDLRCDIRFNESVVSANYRESEDRWAITTDKDNCFDAQFVIMATGCLSSTNIPDFEGLEGFRGDWYHTGLWPKEGVDFSGKKVAVIGTGSSAIQSIPRIAEQADHLTVFQRTPNFSIPAHNRQLKDEFVEDIKSSYADFRAQNRLSITGFGSRMERHEDSVFDTEEGDRNQRFESKWAIGGFGFLSAFGDLLASTDGNKFAAEFVRNKIREIVHDPEVAELLCPQQVIGCKRICVDTDYFVTFNRDNVVLVDIKDTPISRVSEHGIQIQAADSIREYEFDTLVFATGFDAMTGSVLRVDIRGRGGLQLKDKWHAGPRTYLGLSIHGFPNLFTISGPGSPSVLTNMIVSIEQHVDWVCSCIEYMQSRALTSIEAKNDAENAWVDHVNAIAGETLYPSCNSWYLGANVPGKPRVFMPYVGGLPMYTEKCEQVSRDGYAGFSLTKLN